MSGGHAPNAIKKLALDNNDCSINPNKFMLGPNLRNSAIASGARGQYEGF